MGSLLFLTYCTTVCAFIQDLGVDKIRGLKRCRFLHFARLTDIGTLDRV